VEDGILIKPINGIKPAPGERARGDDLVSLYGEQDAPPEAGEPRWKRQLTRLADRFRGQRGR